MVIPGTTLDLKTSPAGAHHLPLAPPVHEAPCGAGGRKNDAPFAYHPVVLRNDLIDRPDGVQDLLELAPIPGEVLGTANWRKLVGKKIMHDIDR